MMNNNWHGLIKIEEICHRSDDGKILWRASNLRNTLHGGGEQFILSALFLGGKNSTIIPEAYLFGLDNRVEILQSNTMANIVGEPTSNGYSRQAVPSTGQFQLGENEAGVTIVRSPIVVFAASSGSWGPVTNLFMTDKSDGSGSLIASVPLTSTLTVNAGESIYLRMGLSLKDCP
jgi:hypothetical protein